MPEEIIPQTTQRQLRYDFTAVETHDMALKLANKKRELAAVEEEKKSVTSQYAARVNEVKATCNKLSNQVSDGYEIRDVKCMIDYHKPEQGMKTLTREDNNQTIVEKMDNYEWNLFNQPDIEDSDLIDEVKTNLRGKKKRK